MATMTAPVAARRLHNFLPIPRPALFGRSLSSSPSSCTCYNVAIRTIHTQSIHTTNDTIHRWRRCRPWEERRCVLSSTNLCGISGNPRLLATISAAPGRVSSDGHQHGPGDNTRSTKLKDDKSKASSNNVKQDGKEYDSDENESDSDDEDYDDGPSDSLYKILTGRPQPNPGDYEGTKDEYEIPKTMEGWKVLFSKTWEQYYSTFEGWETEEEREEREREERRAKGIPDDEDDDDEGEEEEETVYEIEIDEDAIKRKQKEVTDNLGRNLNAVSSTGQELKQWAGDQTGMRTKEDLKRWAGEQMKLMTACLSEFMGGYREGRDEEVDRMLNEYFKELDEAAEEATKDEGVNADQQSDSVEANDDHDNDKVHEEQEQDAPKAGRRRRRRRA